MNHGQKIKHNSMGKFKKDYDELTVNKTINFFRKRLDERPSRICDAVEKILCENSSYTRNQVILYLNTFAKWYANYYEKLPNNNFKMVYFKTVCKMWREKNNDKWKVLELDSTEWSKAVMSHISNLFAALFRSERARLYRK
jgi:hypothetical protein